MGWLIRGRSGAICLQCLRIAKDVAGERGMIHDAPALMRRQRKVLRWKANMRWRARGLPEIDDGHPV